MPLPPDAVPVESMNQQVSPQGLPPDAVAVDSGYAPESMPAEPSSQSPISLADQLKFGFADDKGKENLLKEKFQFVKKDEQGNYLVGQDPANMQTVVPDGLTSDIPGKIARHISDINVITGSIIGAGIGSPGGPGGAIGGSAIGAGTGEALNKFIGKSIGVNSQDPKEMATDIVINSAFGAAGEGANQILIKAGERMMPVGLNMIKNAIANKPIEEQPFVVKAAAKLLNFSSNVKEESILTALEFGPDNVLAKGNGSDKHLYSIMNNVSNKFSEKDVQYGTMLGKAKNELAEKVRTPQPTAEIQANIYSSMKELGLIDEYGVVNKDMTGDQKSVYNKLAPLFKQLGGVEDSKIPQFIGDVKSGNVRSLAIDSEAARPVTKLFQIDSAARMAMDSEVDSQVAKNFYSLVYGNSNSRYGQATKGLANMFSELADKTGVTAMKEANQALSQVKLLKESFKKAGVDITNPRSMENFVKSGVNDSVVIRELLNKTDSIFKSNYTQDIRVFDAAKDMSKVSPHFFRFGIIGGLAGLNYLRQPGPGSAAYLGLSILGGTPYGAGLILKGASKVAPSMAKAGVIAGKSSRAGSQVLAKLLQSKTSQKGKQ